MIAFEEVSEIRYRNFDIISKKALSLQDKNCLRYDCRDKQ